MVDISYRGSLSLSSHQFERQPSLRGLIDYSHSDDDLALRWRRLISPFIAATIKPALLSPLVLTCSISSMTSCGMRTVVICDFAFFAPVAITESSTIWCISLYIKSKLEKVLTFISLKDKVKYTLMNSRQKIATPRSATNTIEAFNHNIIGANAMADTQSNQTRLKFTFLIASGTQRLAGMSSLIFVSRQGAYHE
ncbi:hypothetical protein Xets_02526 [Xenorhabdus sp. TS4]|nr:hypothetical protein [Xenorhabdus sp. TS4]